MLANFEEKNHLQDLDIEDNVLLKWKTQECLRRDWCGSKRGQVWGYSEYDNEISRYFFGQILG